MSIEIWAAYTVAAAIVLIIPGPTILLVISQAMAQGRRSVLPLTLGVVAGDGTALTLSLVGMGAVLAASAALFTLLKWAGALYLIYLGIKLWRAPMTTAAMLTGPSQTRSRSFFVRAFAVTALNPKSIIFFVAFLPQFISKTSPLIPQLLILGSTFLVLAGINAGIYGLFAGRLGDTLQKPRNRRRLNRLGGSLLIGAGIFTAALDRAST